MKSIKIDFTSGVLEIDGKAVTEKPVIVTLPSAEERFPYRKLFNPELATGRQEECDRIEVIYKSSQ